MKLDYASLFFYGSYLVLDLILLLPHKIFCITFFFLILEKIWGRNKLLTTWRFLELNQKNPLGLVFLERKTPEFHFNFLIFIYFLYFFLCHFVNLHISINISSSYKFIYFIFIFYYWVKIYILTQSLFLFNLILFYFF